MDNTPALRFLASCPILHGMTAPYATTDNPVAVPATMPGRNGGTLMRGGRHGKPGPKPSKIRKKALRLLWQNVDVLGHIASGNTVEWGEKGKQELVTPKPSERVAAIKVLTEISMGQQVNAGDIRERLRQQVAVIQSRPTWNSEDLLVAISRVWG